MQNNNIMNLFGFKDVVFDRVDESNNFVNVHASVSKMSIVLIVVLKRSGFMIIEFKRLGILTSEVRNL
ncbi:hypothetical protein [Peptoniphilus asaccharolyticus]|uniref:hypothetical protein n=1 Tax=Peptoniphilus asaccharolyticus TaxID=1258 RepID=UPI000A06106D|nr:hypothetical protein [Peptoniphilus asaccharolyticus]